MQMGVSARVVSGLLAALGGMPACAATQQLADLFMRRTCRFVAMENESAQALGGRFMPFWIFRTSASAGRRRALPPASTGRRGGS